MSATLLITPSISTAIVTSAEAARGRRDELVALAADVTAVTDRLDFDDATNTLKQLSAFSKEIEAAHKEAKAPMLKLTREIDAMKKDLISNVDAEADRISKILGAFEAEERRKADEAKQIADAEASRLAYEAEKDAAKARVAAPDSLTAARAADAVVEKAADQIVQLRQQAANAVAPKTAGSTLRDQVEFQVTDIQALYQAHPEMVTLEPNGRVIRAVLDANPNLQVPGLTHKRVPKFSVR